MVNRDCAKSAREDALDVRAICSPPDRGKALANGFGEPHGLVVILTGQNVDIQVIRQVGRVVPIQVLPRRGGLLRIAMGGGYVVDHYSVNRGVCRVNRVGMGCHDIAGGGEGQGWRFVCSDARPSQPGIVIDNKCIGAG